MTSDFDRFLTDFLTDARELIAMIETLILELTDPSVPGDVPQSLRRYVHTLKGNAAMMGLEEIAGCAHAIEDLLDETTPVGVLLIQLDRIRTLVKRADPSTVDVGEDANSIAAKPDTKLEIDSVRVSFPVLDTLVEDVAEIVLHRNRLGHLIAEGQKQAREDNHSDALWPELAVAEHELGRVLDVVQERILALRMVPLRVLFGGLKRIVRDIGLNHGKKCRFVGAGGDTPIDKALLDVAMDTLGHLVRNALVHGIEEPDERLTAGKSRAGYVRVEAFTKGGEVVITVTDDGRGIDTQRLLEVAAASGVDVSNVPSPLELLFVSGLSTQDDTDMSAGRGVGMGAVRQAVSGFGGRIHVESQPGVGTRFSLFLPMSVLILRALMCEADGEVYALPLTAVVENLPLADDSVHMLNGAAVLPWRDQVLTALDLGVAFETREQVRRDGIAVVIEVDGEHRALLSHRLLGIREVVVRKLDPIFESPRGLLGSTILSDGHPVLILEPAQLLDISPFIEVQ